MQMIDLKINKYKYNFQQILFQKIARFTQLEALKIDTDRRS